MIAGTSADAVSYLESAGYEIAGHPAAICRTLIELVHPFPAGDWLDPFSAQECCDANSSLCTGDGYRWAPPLPIMRFPVRFP